MASASEPPRPEASGLEAPTGRWAPRGPTLFVLGVMLAVAIVSIVRSCA